MTDLMAAEFAIRQLQARYADALWHKDPDSFAALFTRDGEWKISGMHMRGREEIRQTFAKYMVHLDRCLMTFRTPIVDVVDGVLTSRTYVTEQNKFADGQAASTLGIYYERFAEEEGRLLFRWRHWNMYYIGPADLSEKFYPVKEFGPPPGFPAPDDPTTVRTDFLFTDAQGRQTAEP
jgi:ketosteroid isomerase-like protein